MVFSEPRLKPYKSLRERCGEGNDRLSIVQCAWTEVFTAWHLEETFSTSVTETDWFHGQTMSLSVLKSKRLFCKLQPKNLLCYYNINFF